MDSHIKPILKEDSLLEELLCPWADALNRGDLKAVAAAYEDPCLLLATLENSPCRDRESIRSYFQELVDRKVSVEWEWIESFQEGDWATCSGWYVFSFGSGPPPRHLRARFTFVCQRQPKKWRIRVHHSSMMPFPDKRGSNPRPFLSRD